MTTEAVATPLAAPNHGTGAPRRVTRRSALGMLALAAAAVTMLGCGVPWRVVTQAAPDPFVGQRRFAVAPIDFSGLYVGQKSEGEYLAGKKPEQQASFAEDKDAMTEEFGKALERSGADEGLEIFPAAARADAAFVIHASVQDLEPGFYVGVASEPSTVRMVVRFTTPDGKLLDEIWTSHSTSAGMLTAASGTRLRRDGAALGAITAKYLKRRVAGSN